MPILHLKNYLFFILDNLGKMKTYPEFEPSILVWIIKKYINNLFLYNFKPFLAICRIFVAANYIASTGLVGQLKWFWYLVTIPDIYCITTKKCIFFRYQNFFMKNTNSDCKELMMHISLYQKTSKHLETYVLIKVYQIIVCLSVCSDWHFRPDYKLSEFVRLIPEKRIKLYFIKIRFTLLLILLKMFSNPKVTL